MTGEARSAGLLDTNVVIHLAELDGRHLPDDMVISAVTLGELSVGPHTVEDATARARRIATLQHAEALFEPMPFDLGAARAFGLISATVIAAGRQSRRRTADLMIASIAFSNGLPLYTMDAKDYVGLEDMLPVIAVPRP